MACEIAPYGPDDDADEREKEYYRSLQEECSVEPSKKRPKWTTYISDYKQLRDMVRACK